MTDRADRALRPRRASDARAAGVGAAIRPRRPRSARRAIARDDDLVQRSRHLRLLQHSIDELALHLARRAAAHSTPGHELRPLGRRGAPRRMAHRTTARRGVRKPRSADAPPGSPPRRSRSSSSESPARQRRSSASDRRRDAQDGAGTPAMSPARLPRASSGVGPPAGQRSCRARAASRSRRESR